MKGRTSMKTEAETHTGKTMAAIVAAALTAALCLPATALAGEATERLTLGSQEPAVASTQATTPKDGDTRTVANTSKVQRVTWSRIWGQTQYDTMAKIAQKGWSGASTVLLATSASYYDALSASALAGVNGAPVLMTAPASLTAQTKAELSRLKPKKVVIVGGTSAVKPAVESAIKAMGITVERVWGAAADDTAVAVAKKLGSNHSDTCIVATDSSFQDALSASPYSYAKKAPIFLTRGKGASLSAATVAAIKSGGYKRVIVAGGTSAVKPAAYSQLTALGIAVERVWGNNACDTSAALAKRAIKDGMSAKGMAVATSATFYDALCGAALCGKTNSVLVLADVSNTSQAAGVAASGKPAGGTSYVLGGTSAVKQAVLDALVAAVTDTVTTKTVQTYHATYENKWVVDKEAWDEWVNYHYSQCSDWATFIGLRADSPYATSSYDITKYADKIDFAKACKEWLEQLGHVAPLIEVYESDNDSWEAMSQYMKEHRGLSYRTGTYDALYHHDEEGHWEKTVTGGYWA